MKTVRLLLAALILVAPFAANSAPITWTLTTDDSHSGTFDYDADTGTYSGITIAGCCGEDYSLGSVDVANSSSTALSLDGFIYPDSLLLNFDTALTNAGGLVSGTWYELLNYLDVSETNYTLTGSFSVSAVGVVPEPGTLALLGIGLLGFGLAKRKRSV